MSGEGEDSEEPELLLEPATDETLFAALVVCLDSMEDMLACPRDRDGTLSSFFACASTARDALLRVCILLETREDPSAADAEDETPVQAVLDIGKVLLLCAKNFHEPKTSLSQWMLLEDHVGDLRDLFDSLVGDIEMRDRLVLHANRILVASSERRTARLAARTMVDDLQPGAPRPKAEPVLAELPSVMLMRRADAAQRHANERLAQHTAERERERLARRQAVRAEYEQLIESADLAAAQAWAARRAGLASDSLRRDYAATSEIRRALQDKSARRREARAREMIV